ncbi:MAG: phosphohydrolase [Okeania sp. SIO3H1]|nr:phosphohydrolase [Okeania sp. SIO3H1]
MDTYTGKLVDLQDIKPDDIDIIDIAHSLARQCRFGGHCEAFYSVAQHSVILSIEVAKAKKGDAFFALMHDATEAYVGDIIHPLKVMLPGFKEIEERVWEAVKEKFHIEVSPDDHATVMSMDRRLALNEGRALLEKDISPEEYGVEQALPDPMGLLSISILKTMDPRYAYALFMQRFHELYNG